MKKLLSWMHHSDRKVIVSQAKKADVILDGAVFFSEDEENDPRKERIWLTRRDTSLRGFIADNGEAWLVKESMIKVLNKGTSLLYMKDETVCNELFLQDKIIAVLSPKGEILCFAPQYRYRFQLWLFKLYFKRHADRKKWQTYFKYTLSLANFLWRNNPNKSCLF